MPDSRNQLVLEVLIRKPAPAQLLDSWHVDPSANRNYDFIDGLRGLAILMVLICHSVYARDHQDVVGRSILAFTGTLGRGVDLFFTLSGFLISWPFWKRKANRDAALMPKGYGWRRFWKIYPPLALSILLLTPCYILIYSASEPFLPAAAQWLAGLAFVMPVSGALNPVMWSLVVEVHFYVVLPLLFLLTKPLPARTCLWVISLFLLVVPTLVSALTGIHAEFAPQIKDPYCLGLGSFCFGVAVAGVDALKLWDKRWIKIGDAGWFIMLAGLVGLAWAQSGSAGQATLLQGVFNKFYALGTGCLLCYAASPDNSRMRWLCTPWLRWFGIISFEWYLFHQPMITWGRHFFGPANGNPLKYALIMVVPFIASLIVAACVYRLFSLPILKYGRARKSAHR